MREPRDINYYTLLGVPEDATQEQIQSAYREKIQKIHPDKFSDVLMGEDDEDLRRGLNRKAADLNEAYKILNDMDVRRRHDLELKEKRDATDRASTGNPSSSSTTELSSAAPRPSPGNTDEARGFKRKKAGGRRKGLLGELASLLFFFLINQFLKPSKRKK